MRKTKVVETENKITVDIEGLKGMLSVGRTTAEEIARNAEAVIKVGRRKLYNVKKVEEYMRTLARG